MVPGAGLSGGRNAPLVWLLFPPVWCVLCGLCVGLTGLRTQLSLALKQKPLPPLCKRGLKFAYSNRGRFAVFAPPKNLRAANDAARRAGSSGEDRNKKRTNSDESRGYIEERAFEEKKLGTELNGYNRWFCGAGISKRAVPLSGGGTAM